MLTTALKAARIAGTALLAVGITSSMGAWARQGTGHAGHAGGGGYHGGGSAHGGGGGMRSAPAHGQVAHRGTATGVAHYGHGTAAGVARYGHGYGYGYPYYGGGWIGYPCWGG